MVLDDENIGKEHFLFFFLEFTKTGIFERENQQKKIKWLETSFSSLMAKGKRIEKEKILST